MQSNKEALLAIYRGQMPEFIPAEYLCLRDLAFPGERYFGQMDSGYDAWGVSWRKLGPDPGLDGSTVSANFRLFDNMDEWKKYVKFPDFEQLHVKEALQGQLQGIDRDQMAVSTLLLSGQFERLNEMIGMENALCAFYEYPDDVHEYMDAICEYKLKCIELAHEYMNPEIIHMHDDWGMAQNMFMSPEIWREFIKPNEMRYAKKIHELGMLYEHHSCGYITQIIPDFVEIGIDVINPLNVCNDLDGIKKEYGARITLKGGIDNQELESGECNEKKIRKAVQKAIDKYAVGGRFLPYFVYTSKEVRDIFTDEVAKYGATIYNNR